MCCLSCNRTEGKEARQEELQGLQLDQNKLDHLLKSLKMAKGKGKDNLALPFLRQESSQLRVPVTFLCPDSSCQDRGRQHWR